MSWFKRQLNKPFEQHVKLLAYILGLVILAYIIIILHNIAFPTPDVPRWGR